MIRIELRELGGRCGIDLELAFAQLTIVVSIQCAEARFLFGERPLVCSTRFFGRARDSRNHAGHENKPNPHHFLLLSLIHTRELIGVPRCTFTRADSD
jgi:hypothetical protein